MTQHQELETERAAMTERLAQADELVADLRSRPCPHCHLPAVLPDVCTPEVNEAIEAGLQKNGELYVAGWTAGRILDSLVHLGLESSHG